MGMVPKCALTRFDFKTLDIGGRNKHMMYQSLLDIDKGVVLDHPPTWIGPTYENFLYFAAVNDFFHSHLLNLKVRIC